MASKSFLIQFCWRAVLIVVASVASVASPAAEIRMSSDFDDVAEIIDAYAAKFGPEHVLLVADIDNTLLSMDEPLGSEQWFDWQVFLLKHEPKSPQLVASSFPGILDVQGLLYNRGAMHPPQPDLPAVVSKLQDHGVSAIVLTSRGDDFRPATERELKRNGFDFARTALPTGDEVDSLYMPYDPSRPAAAGINAREISTLKLQSPQKVSYRNGIMMTSGQHKGIMLVTLLHRCSLPIKAVVFVDNRADHVAGVYSQMQEEGMEVTGVVYQREDDNIKAFLYGSKDSVTSEWREINAETAAPTAATQVRAGGPKRGRILPRRIFCR
ncbi:MAG: DUF2608 domain-containing protein [Pirellulales bacterium]